MRKALALILVVLSLDQWIKLWVKVNFTYGEARPLISGWFELQFVENPGMAFGWFIPGAAGKLTLSLFRLVVAGAIVWYLIHISRKKMHVGYVMCVSLILAGALGNILDSAVYGLMFDRGASYNHGFGYEGVAQLNGQGYAPFLMGNVVDMFHLSKQVSFPGWFPFWGGQTREIFPPVFNIADSSITTGILLILFFQRRFFPKSTPKPVHGNSSESGLPVNSNAEFVQHNAP